MKEKKIDRRTFIKGASLTGLAVSTFGFPTILRSATKMEEVEIGVVYPLTGYTGAMGTNAIRGWNIAVDEINAEGGIKSLGGAKIKTALADTQSTPRIAMIEIEKVAQNKNIPLVVGCWASATTFPATQVSEQYGLPHIVDTATNPAILERGFKYCFRIIAHSRKMNEQVLDFVLDIGKKTGHVPKRAAILGIDDSYGRSSSEDFKGAIKKKTDQEIVEEIYYSSKATNLDVEIAKIKAAKTDAIYASGYFTDATLIVRALQAQKVNLIGYLTGGSGYFDPKFLESVGPLANYILGLSVWNYDLTRPQEQQFQDKVKKRYGVDANHHSALMYSTAYIIKDVLERAGTIDREKVRDAIAKTHITSGRALTIPAKFIKFDEKGENIGLDIVMVQCFEGAYHTVWPSEFKGKYNPVWPIPKWEDR